MPLNRRRPPVLSLVLSLVLGCCVAAWLWLERDRAQAPIVDLDVDTKPVAAPAPEFSVSSRAFTGSLLVELTDPSGRGELCYTLDGSEPTRESTRYSAPIRVARTLELAARIFGEGSESGPPARRTYVRVDERVGRFRSEIPVILIETFGREIQRYRPHDDGPTPYVSSVLHVVEPDDQGVCRITAPASFSGRVGIRARGSSTLGREKTSLTLEIQDHLGDDLDVPLLGLPAESDWVLLGPMEYDRALIRNALIYQVARDAGRYAPRTRFVEVFLNEDGGPIGGNVPEGPDYYGVYVLIEKIKRGDDRVAIESLSPEEVAGGYILKVDRAGPGDHGFRSGGGRFHFVYPKETNVTSEQAAWIEAYLDGFHAALRRRSRSAERGYSRYLDVDSAIDYHIINEFTKNPDSYVYSAYFHKPRDGRLTLGPVWDFDRAMGCDNDRRARNPRGWSRNLYRLWYGELFDDPEFAERYRRRWKELRGGPFEETRLLGLVDAMAESIAAAAERNTARWGRWIGLRPGGWSSEIDQLKDWLRSRLRWYDEHVADL